MGETDFYMIITILTGFIVWLLVRCHELHSTKKTLEETRIALREEVRIAEKMYQKTLGELLTVETTRDIFEKNYKRVEEEKEELQNEIKKYKVNMAKLRQEVHKLSFAEEKAIRKERRNYVRDVNKLFDLLFSEKVS